MIDGASARSGSDCTRPSNKSSMGPETRNELFRPRTLVTLPNGVFFCSQSTALVETNSCAVLDTPANKPEANARLESGLALPTVWEYHWKPSTEVMTFPTMPLEFKILGPSQVATNCPFPKTKFPMSPGKVRVFCHVRPSLEVSRDVSANED